VLQKPRKVVPRYIAIPLCIFAGICAGAAYIPMTIWEQGTGVGGDPEEREPVKFIFSQAVGIFLTVVVIFFSLFYCSSTIERTQCIAS